MDQYERHMFRLKEWQRTSFYIPSWAKAENLVYIISLKEIWKAKAEEGAFKGEIRKNCIKCFVLSACSYVKEIVNRLVCK